eukprot:TRINITY_DN5238_c0_g1_i1.p1 TRINITY_DN5238_c0_g1~~TRINITY_DN5238_c0_g1_i1.p1  ORF type:complete len:212 (+),score=-6.61 TRINITY_DN5238_c0_g1_i1:56-637(+)
MKRSPSRIRNTFRIEDKVQAEHRNTMSRSMFRIIVIHNQLQGCSQQQLLRKTLIYELGENDSARQQKYTQSKASLGTRKSRAPLMLNPCLPAATGIRRIPVATIATFAAQSVRLSPVKCCSRDCCERAPRNCSQLPCQAVWSKCMLSLTGLNTSWNSRGALGPKKQIRASFGQPMLAHNHNNDTMPNAVGRTA